MKMRDLTLGAHRVGQKIVSRLRRAGRGAHVIVPNGAQAALLETRDGTESLPITKCATLGEFSAYTAHHAELLAQRASFEASLVPPNDHFSLPGYCAVCRADTTFFVDYLYSSAPAPGGRRTPNWRERLICQRCKLPNRGRAMLDFLESRVRPPRTATIYVTEHTTPFYRALVRRYPNAIGSEFLRDGTKPGKSNWLKVRHEDLTNLTLPDASVDAICTADVLEHIPAYKRAITECFRCLRPGGPILITVPFLLTSQSTLVRAQIRDDGSVHHLLAPEYHGDPLDPQGVLCFYHFGWDLLESLVDVGFCDAGLYLYWSFNRGYLGGLQFVISAKHPG